MLESAVQLLFTDWLDQRGIKWTKSIVNSRAGDSDLTICYKGLYIACEVKKFGKKPTQLQTAKLLKVHRSGGMAFYSDNLGEFVAHLQGIDTTKLVQNWYIEPDVNDLLEL